MCKFNNLSEILGNSPTEKQKETVLCLSEIEKDIETEKIKSEKEELNKLIELVKSFRLDNLFDENLMETRILDYLTNLVEKKNCERIRRGF